MSAPALPREAEAFLRRLRLGLSTLPKEERDDIVAEVRSHLADRHAAGKQPLLEGFEDPETYASRFVAETALRGALARGTSFELGKALLTGARTGLVMLFAVVPLLLVELIGAAFIILAALKPFVPSHVGWFVDENGAFVALGAHYGAGSPREILGFWSFPLFLIAGVALLWLGNRALRALAKWRLAD